MPATLQAVDASGGATSWLADCETKAVERPWLDAALDEDLVKRVGAFLTPLSKTDESILAVRVLTAASIHDGLTERLLRDGCLPLILERLRTSGESLSIPIAALLHNLADTPANQMRLIAGGAVAALTHIVLDPAAGGTLKEHCLQAVASMAGRAEAEISFPAVCGLLCSSRLPGTQREGLRALALLAERADLRGRLSAVDEIQTGLQAARASRDAAVAEQAAELTARLQ